MIYNIFDLILIFQLDSYLTIRFMINRRQWHLVLQLLKLSKIDISRVFLAACSIVFLGGDKMEISKRVVYFGMVSIAIILALVGSGLITINNQAFADSLDGIPRFEDCFDNPESCMIREPGHLGPEVI